MRRSPRQGLLLAWLALVATPAGAQEAAAPPSIVLVVEDATSGLDAAGLRAALGARVGSPIASLEGAGAATAAILVSVALTGTGEAHLVAVASAGGRAHRRVAGPPPAIGAEAWLVSELEILLSALPRDAPPPAGRPGLLTWSGAAAFDLEAPVSARALLPWPDPEEPVRPPRPRHPERGEGLDAPRPRRPDAR